MPGNSIFSANNTGFMSRPVTQPISTIAPPQCNLIWVNNKDEVLNHPTSANETLYFGCRADEPVMWVRETDANGRIRNPLHKLRYTVEEDPFGPEAQFVTKDKLYGESFLRRALLFFKGGTKYA